MKKVCDLYVSLFLTPSTPPVFDSLLFFLHTGAINNWRWNVPRPSTCIHIMFLIAHIFLHIATTGGVDRRPGNEATVSKGEHSCELLH